MKLAIVLLMGTIGASALTGCDQTNAPTPDKAQELSGQLTYFRDSRTGLCFAAIQSTTYSAYSVTSLTNVPCDQMPIRRTP